MTRPQHGTGGGEASLSARMPADVDAPDKVAYGLTFRQLAVLAVGALFGYTAFDALHRLLPMVVLAGAGVVFAGLVFGLAVGRRDGLPLDGWLWHAVRHSRAPKARSTAESAGVVPDWVAAPKQPRTALPAPLRLPADAIGDDGQLRLPGGTAAVVAATGVNLALRTLAEQAASVEAFGRWLNALSAPVQIVVSAQPVDLTSHARAVADAADQLPDPALADAAADHAAFLADLASHRDPLHRQVLIVCPVKGPHATATATSGHGPGRTVALRRAEDTARTLAGLGVATRVLDGAAVTAALAAAADPYRPARPGGAATEDTTITGPALAAPAARAPGKPQTRQPRRTR